LNVDFLGDKIGFAASKQLKAAVNHDRQTQSTNASCAIFTVSAFSSVVVHENF